MPNEIESLHTAIRRYCFDRYSYWSTRYGELISRGADRIGNKYTEEALDAFPRYNVIDAITVEVERCRPQDLSSLDEAKTIFRAVCASAQSIFTQPPNGQLEQTAMNEERLALDKLHSQFDLNRSIKSGAAFLSARFDLRRRQRDLGEIAESLGYCRRILVSISESSKDRR